jgi:hypothetical protein
MYGLHQKETAGFGKQCLLARRFVEAGVRFTLLIHGVQIGPDSWDDHGSVETGDAQALKRSRPTHWSFDCGFETTRIVGRDLGDMGLRNGPHAIRERTTQKESRPRT